VQFGASSQWKYQTGNVSRSRVEELTFAPDGGASICGGFNPFGLDSVTADCADYISLDAGIDADVEQWIGEATARGSAVTLPAGPCAWRSACNIAATSIDTMRMKPADNPAGWRSGHRRLRGGRRHQCRRPQHGPLRRGRDSAAGGSAGHRID
jgi:hypothetical protein